MKKEVKTTNTGTRKVETAQMRTISEKASLKISSIDKINIERSPNDRHRSKVEDISSPNKENQYSTANKQK